MFIVAKQAEDNFAFVAVTIEIMPEPVSENPIVVVIPKEQMEEV